MAAEAPVLTNFVDGQWTSSSADEFLDVPDPSSGALLARVPLSGSIEVDRAVVAARRAFPGWRDTPVADRARALARLRDLLEQRAEDLATSITRENGKILAEARGSVRRGIEAVEFAISTPTLLQGSVLQNVSPGVDAELFREPVGVVAGITPFNFPVMVPLWMAPIALGCGNCFILKPSERVPISAGLLGRCISEAGFPPGVFNLVHGSRETVQALIRHPKVDAVVFVGSAPVARSIYTTAAAEGKRVLALAGAKNFLIVMPDADLPRTVDAILASAFGSAGERCLAGSVVVAVAPVGDPLVAALAARIQSLKLGSGLQPEVEMGPLIRPDHRARVESYIERGKAEGAQLAARGSIPVTSGPGFYVPPILFDHVRPEMTIAQEEIFGPVLSIIRVNSLAEALEVANRSPFGNASAIFTRDGKAAREFRERIEAGMVGINIGVPAPAAYFPFVGWKGSVYGDLAATGREAISFYTRVKTVTTRWF
jgi:malonate-semialdehyde dehydrogenase (acetylating) / methylmalonate-semialdehyde dehydrogenase